MSRARVTRPAPGGGYATDASNPHEKQRVLLRRIRWWPEPRNPILKDCSGQLGEYTDVDFTEDDFETLKNKILAAGALITCRLPNATMSHPRNRSR